MPGITYRPPRRRLPNTLRRQHLEQALTESGWSTRERAAASLVLLYALSPAAIVRITADQLTPIGDGATLTIGKTPLSLPPAISALLLELPDGHRDGAAAAARPHDEPRWLFPGDRPGHHLDPTTLARLLRQHGIQPRLARNTAMAELALEVPVPAIAALLGVCTTTAESWAHSQGFGHTYAAAAARRSPSKTPPSAPKS